MKSLCQFFALLVGVPFLASCQKNDRLSDWIGQSEKLQLADSKALQQWLKANALKSDTFLAGESTEHRGDHSVLVRNQKIISIRANGIKSLEGLASLEALEELDLRKPRLKNLRNCPSSLKSLVLRWGSIDSLAGIESCQQLTSVRVLGTKTGDFAPVTKLKDLQTLELNQHELRTLTISDQLPHLTRLILNNNQLTSLQGLENAPGIETLVIADNELTTLPALEKLGSLKSLDLQENRLTDLNELAASPSVETLNLLNNPVEDLTPLTKWAALKKIVFRPVIENGEVPASLLNKLDERFNDHELQERKARSLMHSFLEGCTFVETLDQWNLGQARSVSRQISSHFSHSGTAKITGSISIGELKGMTRLALASPDNILYQHRNVKVRGTVRAESGGVVVLSPVDLDFWQRAQAQVDKPVKEAFPDDSLRKKGFVVTEAAPGKLIEFSANLQSLGSDYALLISAKSRTATNVEIILNQQ